MKAIVAFSGGKDSTAALLWAFERFGRNGLEVVFCDTGWEHPDTYGYIAETIEGLGLEAGFTVLRDRDRLGFAGLVRKKGVFPSPGRRFCTEHLKVRPMVDYILDRVQGHCAVVQGVRREESPARAAMHGHCRYFRHYSEPYDRNDWKLARLEASPVPRDAQRRDVRQRRIAALREKVGKGRLEPRLYSYRKAEVLAREERHATEAWRPVFEWTAAQVVEYVLSRGLRPSPLYYRGAGRVGCWPCIHASNGELWRMAQDDPAAVERVAALEREIGGSFLGPGSVPARYCSGRAENRFGEAARFPYIGDAVRYLRDRNATGSLFGEAEKEEMEGRGCMSALHVCER